MENLATRIRRLREHCNLTQEYVAEQLGISVRTYRQLEHKDGTAAHLLTLKRLQILADVLNMPLSAFLSEPVGPQTNLSPPPRFSGL